MDGIREDPVAAKVGIEKALADLDADALGAAKGRHPAGKNTRKTAVA